MAHLLTKILSPIKSNAVKVNYTILRLSGSKPKYTAQLDSEIEDQFENQGLAYRKHCGKRNVGCVTLPPKLDIAAQKIINKYNSPQFKEDVCRMSFRFHVNQMPTEENELRERAQEIAYMFAIRENIDIDSLDELEREEVLERIRKKTIQRLKHVSFLYKEVVFDEYMSAVYMAARLAPNYAALFSVFNEIKKADPNFVPTSLFDFGSGIGTTIWAANESWHKSINEFFCVDISSEINETCRLLLQGGEENKKMSIDSVFHRQFLPASHNIKYDMVVSAFSLLELPDAKNRIHVIENLWNKTQDLLVIVEHGTRSGFNAVIEARNLILDKTGHKLTERFAENTDTILDTDVTVDKQYTDSHIIAPCPHEFSCPRHSLTKKQICRFNVVYEPLDYGLRSDGAEKEPFSYVVLRKGQRKYHSKMDSWPRIVQPVLRKHRHSVCRMCCSDGKLHEIVFTKAKHGKHLYNCAALSKWGDKLPAYIMEKSPINENMEENNDNSEVNNDNSEVNNDNSEVNTAKMNE